MNQLIVALLLSIAPVSELRGGIPIAVEYCLRNNLSVNWAIAAMIAANILIIFPIFFFLDNFHNRLMKLSFYRRLFNAYLRKLRKKVDDFEKKKAVYGFAALMIFVAVPLPGTGAWTGTIIAWILGLERKKSIISIALGVIIAGILIGLATLGVFNLFI
jgi:uncharacterized membrane protein